MPTARRPYWLTRPARLRREGGSLRFEPLDGPDPIRIPVEDVESIVAAAPIDINTAAASLLAAHRIDLHVLDHYGNHVAVLAHGDAHTSGHVIRRQVLAGETGEGLDIARRIVTATARTVRWAHGPNAPLLDRALAVCHQSAAQATTREQLMGAEGTFRRASWALLDESLPDWLHLSGRSRRPPANAGNAFVSYAHGIIYARCLHALRQTPLHPAVGFLHATTDRRRWTLALDLAELFKPLFSERFLLRCAAQRSLNPTDFHVEAAAASLSDDGRRKVITLIRDELNTTVHHRGLDRPVSYDELIRLDAYKLCTHLLTGEPYRPFTPWW